MRTIEECRKLIGQECLAKDPRRKVFEPAVIIGYNISGQMLRDGRIHEHTSFTVKLIRTSIKKRSGSVYQRTIEVSEDYGSLQII